MSIDVLQLCPMSDAVSRALQTRYRVHRFWEATDQAAFLAAHGQTVRAIATGGHLGAGRSLVEQLPNLEIIVVNGVGYDRIDLDFVRSRGIRVTNTPDVLTDDVADLALGLALSLARRIAEGDRHVRAGMWPSGPLPLAHKFSAYRFGLLGLGRIGKAIARRLEGFKVQICYCDPAAQDVPYQRQPNLVSLAEASDVLIIAAAASDSTAKIVDAAVLDALGPNGLLVNIARGSIVDEAALIEALQDGRIAGAALDVFAEEPMVPTTLTALPNVVLTPHIASATVETRHAMGELMLANLDAHLRGQDLLTPIV